MERAIRWFPSPPSSTTDHRFLTVDVTGRTFKLNRVTSLGRAGLQYEVLSTYSKTHAFRAFDWSPVDESLIAIGQSSGDAIVLRMTEGPQESYSFPTRNPRPCNAVAFSHHGLLAAGVDRSRGDFCLNVWDVNQRLAMRGPKGPTEPVKKLAGSESITSIKFFKAQPDLLVTGVKGQYVRIYDLRASTGSPSLQFPTRCVHNLSIDALDENYIASCSTSSDPTVCIWDRRAGSRFISTAVGPTHFPEAGQPGPVLELKNVLGPKSSIWSLRFSRTKRGRLGVLSNAGHLKIYNIAKEHVLEEYRISVDETLGQGSLEDYPEPIYIRHVRNVCGPFNHPTRGCKESERIVSFDFLNVDLTEEPSVITLFGNGQANINTLKPPPPPVGLSSQGFLAFGSSCERGFKIIEPLLRPGLSASDVIQSIRVRAQQMSNKPLAGNQKTLSSCQSREYSLPLGTQGCRLKVEDALALLSVARLRCQEGYLFDETRNKQILTDDPYLRDFWEFIKRAHSDSSDQSFIINNLDLNYLGVYSIWNNDLGQSFQSRQINTHMEPAYVSEAIIELARELNLPRMRGCETNYPEHRGLCLRIIGAVQSQRELEELAEELSADGRHTKAAILAVLCEDTKLAYTVLRSHGSSQAHKLLAMAIAGAAKGETDTDWEETCAEIAKELTDPYARGILALVGKGDWAAVTRETTLPLKYRVEAALRWLPDEDLTVYLKGATADAVRQGDIEGIVLTGLGHTAAIDLFRSYIQKFQDVQTPALAMSYTVPRFLDDSLSRAQFESWRETYRRQLNSWKMQLHRARFDVTCRKFATTWDGRKLAFPPVQQVSLSCGYCTRPLAQHDISTDATEKDAVQTTTGNPLGASALSGAVCPKCERHMPRCGVCSLWLGSPDPVSKAAMAAEVAAPAERELMRRFVVFCVGCNHGFHAHHAREWFGRHRVCPVPECGCICDRWS